MSELIAITTQDLATAVALRDGFADAGLDTELLTTGERLADARDPVLLVLTGSLEEKPARRLAREAAARSLPVLGLLDSESVSQAAAISARLGLAEAFIKPIDAQEVVSAGRRVVQRARLRAITGIVGETDAMMEVLERAVQIAPVHSTVLITGESGTGKERVARGIHALSPRRHRPFISANVAALPETLLESELFGHEKGSFTGAIGQRKGLFELAHRSTLFLDEVGEMPASTQAKLLRVLEERAFMRVGGETEIDVDVRVIAATNQDLRHLVQAGRFRRDLYYRLNVLGIHLPPLRERRADIPLLVDAFIREASREHDRPRVAVSPEALQLLVEAPWPGNVRELKNLVESMVVLAPGEVIRPEDIPDDVRAPIALPPALLHSAVQAGGQQLAAPAPELEFIFRKLIELRIDVEELRHQFEEYRRHVPPQLVAGMPIGQAIDEPGTYAFRSGTTIHPPRELAHVEPDDVDDASGVVFRPGMTLAELEAAAITAALQQVAGNRRKAAEMLGMGERTLYRKLKEYDIPL